MISRGPADVAGLYSRSHFPEFAPEYSGSIVPPEIWSTLSGEGTARLPFPVRGDAVGDCALHMANSLETLGFRFSRWRANEE